MFSVRIHSLDAPHAEEGCSRSTAAVVPLHPSPVLVDDAVGDFHEEAGTSRNPNPNPRIQLLRGIVHLYRSLSPPSTSASSSSSTTNPQASSESLLPVRYDFGQRRKGRPFGAYHAATIVICTDRHVRPSSIAKRVVELEEEEPSTEETDCEITREQWAVLEIGATIAKQT
ncbi:hypothetical protein B296_00057049 [Ensete ventricosum]|uniref:Uncharacterized protein n=1 Tax=Ensete ventricosum TaxID=4639 RepID=A0A426WX60_ENSVE|nr:hypothetical protein B296_00057049 [Ensete ventricosum]